MKNVLRATALMVVVSACADHQSTAPAVQTVPIAADVAADAHSGNLESGGVFVATNQPTGNAIAAYYRAPNGSLAPAGVFPTGGMGAGGGPDPLRSQGSLILDAQRGDDEPGDHRLLFVVNAGSNDISVMRVEKNTLTLMSKVASGGIRPTSLTLNRKLLYVLNAGSGTITGFHVGKRGALTPIAGSTQAVTGGTAADPSEVSFSPDGRLLVVTGKTFNNIDTYVVEHGIPGPARPNMSSGPTPFGFEFNNTRHLVVSEAFALVPGSAAASSYAASRDGALTVVSASVHDGQSAACWLIITTNGRFAYVSNTNSSNISSYTLSPDGKLALREPIAATTDPGSNPIDLALSAGSRFLFVLTNTAGTIDGYRVADDGSLQRVSSVAGLPPNAAGIAAK
jgi:6-phosphogluconolactonase (cycloisomerase 2 family)